MPKIELLSPAGSFDALKSAVNYGADAVYLGGTSFSARAFANNFNHEEMIEAVKYCHLRGVKVYVTLNTLLNEYELENAIKEAHFYYDINVDALIIQDLGLFYRLKNELPDFPLHASTQMHIHNISGVKNAKKLGFKKVVLARESSLSLIEDACKENIEIECFIHGAICVSYSGQCLMSSVNKNRSANKGMCAQSCRLWYRLFDCTEEKYVDTKTKYLLSPKDMFLLNDIPLLIKAGVSSLKIEGRLKSPAYVGLVTNIYRQAIDAYYNNESFELNDIQFNNLLKVFNRGFTNSYLLGKNDNIFGNIRPNHLGKKIGEVILFKNNKCHIKLSDEVNQFDGIRIINNKEDFGKILNTITLNGKYVANAKKDDIIEINVEQKVNVGDDVVKTYDYELENRINNYQVKRRPINIDIEILLNGKTFIVAKIDDICFSKEYDLEVYEAKKMPIKNEDLINIFSKSDNSPFILNTLNSKLDNIFVPKSKLNELRRKFYYDFEDYILSAFKRTPIDKLHLGDLLVEDNGDLLIENNSQIHYEMQIKKDPVINQNGIYESNVVCEFGNILSNNIDKIGYYSLNVTNSYAYEFLKRLGFKKIILSTELSNDQINNLIKAYKERNNIDIKPYVLVFGRRTLMYIKVNPFKDYIKKNHKYILNDGKNDFNIIFNDDYTEIIETIPLVNRNMDFSHIKPFIIIENNDIETVKKELNIVL